MKKILLAFIAIVSFAFSAHAQTVSKKILTTAEAKTFLKNDPTRIYFKQVPVSKISSRFKNAQIASLELFEDSQTKKRTFIPTFSNEKQKKEFISLLKVTPGSATRFETGGPGNGPYIGCAGPASNCYGYEENGWTIYVYL